MAMPKLKKIQEPQQGVFMKKIDPGALQMLVDKQRERMAGVDLHEACTMGDYDSLEDYLKSGRFDPNYRDPEWQNRAPIHWACTKGFVDCLRLLLDHNAKSSLCMDMGWTPAQCAAETGFVDCLRLLLDHKAKSSLRMDMGWTPAHCAAETGKLNILRALHNAEVPINKKDDYGATPKRIAETYGHWESVKYLQQAENEIKERRKMAGKAEDTDSDSSISDNENEKS